MNKKGYIQDFLFFGIFMLIMVMVIVFSGKILGDVNENYQNKTMVGNVTFGKDMLGGFANRYSSIFDYIFITVFVLFAIAIFVSMWFIDTQPAMFFIVVVIFGFILIALAMIGNVWDRFSNSPLSTEVANYTLSGWLMDNWVFTLMVFGFVALVLLFAKIRIGVFR